MREQIEDILNKYYFGNAIDGAVDEILSLKAESEIGASDADAVQHGVYAVDGECNASEVTDVNPRHTSSAAMEKITSDENRFELCARMENDGSNKCTNQCAYCWSDHGFKSM